MRKQEYSQMLDGYESPTGKTIKVDVGLATLMIISAVAENANKISQKTEGLEQGAVDKLLVGIFVGCDGGGGETYLLSLS